VKPSISLDLLEGHIDEDKHTNDEKTPAKQEVGSPCPIENKKIVRILNDHLSIRLGKYGAYIYYKTEDMTKPVFYNIHKFKQSYKFASEEALLKWIKDTYNVG
jgi:topoisomerase IA-like protein